MEVPEIFMGGYIGGGGAGVGAGAGAGQFLPEKQKPGDHFIIDDLLDFSNEDAVMTDGFFDNVAGNSTDSSIVTAVDSCNSGSGPQFSGNVGSRSFGDSQFTGDLCVPVISHFMYYLYDEFEISLRISSAIVNLNFRTQIFNEFKRKIVLFDQ